MLSGLSLYLLGKKEGFDMKACKRFAEQTQYWSQSQIDDYQNEKLRMLVQHAYNHVPFYRNYFDSNGLTVNDIHSKDDLKKLKILHKADIQNDPSAFMADNAKDFHPVHHHTGGTTGRPFEYYNDRASWALNWALKMRTFTWAGYRYGQDALGVMAGGSLSPKKNMGLSHRLWRWVNNYFTMPITHMDEACMLRYYEEMKRRNIRFLRGYPSAVYTFAEFLNSTGRSLPLEAVFTTAEMLLDFQRKAICEAFGCEVFDTYGCGDGMGQASECEQHHGLHVCFEASIMQIVDPDGMDVAPGEEGEIVLTSLCDYAMPLIRYAPGDMARLADYTCPCGRQSVMLDKIIGRTSDIFKLKNGRVINGLSIPLEGVPELQRFQIIQEAADRVQVLLEPKVNLSNDFLGKIQKMMEYHCGEGIEIDIKVVKHIEVPESEKFRYVISRLS